MSPLAPWPCIGTPGVAQKLDAAAEPFVVWTDQWNFAKCHNFRQTRWPHYPQSNSQAKDEPLCLEHLASLGGARPELLVFSSCISLFSAATAFQPLVQVEVMCLSSPSHPSRLSGEENRQCCRICVLSGAMGASRFIWDAEKWRSWVLLRWTAWTWQLCGWGSWCPWSLGSSRWWSQACPRLLRISPGQDGGRCPSIHRLEDVRLPVPTRALLQSFTRTTPTSPMGCQEVPFEAEVMSPPKTLDFATSSQWALFIKLYTPCEPLLFPQFCH